MASNSFLVRSPWVKEGCHIERSLAGFHSELSSFVSWVVPNEGESLALLYHVFVENPQLLSAFFLVSSIVYL